MGSLVLRGKTVVQLCVASLFLSCPSMMDPVMDSIILAMKIDDTYLPIVSIPVVVGIALFSDPSSDCAILDAPFTVRKATFVALLIACP